MKLYIAVLLIEEILSIAAHSLIKGNTNKKVHHMSKSSSVLSGPEAPGVQTLPSKMLKTSGSQDHAELKIFR